jgi:hypothetical protein
LGKGASVFLEGRQFVGSGDPVVTADRAVSRAGFAGEAAEEEGDSFGLGADGAVRAGDEVDALVGPLSPSDPIDLSAFRTGTFGVHGPTTLKGFPELRNPP